MKRTSSTSKITRRYRQLLRRSLVPNSVTTVKATQRLSEQIMAAGMSSLDLAIMHETILQKEIPSHSSSQQRRTMTSDAGSLFSSVLEAPNSGSVPAGFSAQLHALLSTLSRRTIDLTSDNVALSKRVEILKEAESSLTRSEQQGREVRIEAEQLQEQMRRLSRQLITAQEDERRHISRELHDVIGQILAGINIRLSALKHKAQLNSADVDKHIAQAQRLVHKSVGIVHRFARKLRPPALDDLGLLPALQAHIHSRTQRSKIHATVSVCAAAEQLTMEQRTTLYRVAQEALANIMRHARASSMEIRITQVANSIRMVVQDNGRSFQSQRVLNTPNSKRLGLLGMRERIEMLNGTFEIIAEPEVGTTIIAIIPTTALLSTTIDSALLNTE
ncbi:MAG: sensor histidine kinase [Planctomycetota bacterium]|nr:MAG: sensor histidine kinase [Planctomycetota bacterium]